MGQHILVVDDEEAIRRLLQRFLDSRGYEVLSASSGEQALELAKSWGPQAVLLDLRMPGMSGLETLQELRRRGVAAPVIMITGVDELKTAREAMRLGACDYVLKPFDLAYLEDALMVKLLLASSSEPEGPR